jgi:hypothetical protein
VPNDQQDLDQDQAIAPIVRLKRVAPSQAVTQRARTRTSSTSSSASFDWSDAIGSSDYDPSTIYTASTKDGVGEKLVTRVPPSILGEIAAIIQSRLVPEYRTAQDLVRDALIHRLIYLTEHYEVSTSLRRMLVSEQMRADATRAGMIREEYQKVVELFAGEFEELRKAGDFEGMSALKEEGWKGSINMIQPYREQLEKILLGYGPKPAWVGDATAEAEQAAREAEGEGEGHW